MQFPDRKTGENSKNSLSSWIFAVLIVMTTLFLYREFQNAGWLDKFNFRESNLTLGISFLVGLVASVSSCLAVVGGVIIAFSEKYRSGEKDFFSRTVKPNFLFHIGRLITFFLLGGLLGVIGGTINISGNFVSVYTIVVAAIMGWLGLSILGIAPSLSGAGIRFFPGVTKKLIRLEESRHQAAPFLLGAITFFLPCGFTQSMQVLALVSGSFSKGALSLFLFALGTMPVLLALGIATTWARDKKFEVFQKVAGILILVFAIFTFKSALALQGVKTNMISSTANKERLPALPTGQAGGRQELQANERANGDSGNPEQIVEMRVTSRGFEPGVLKVKQNIPVRWKIMGDNVTGCTNKIVVPDLNIAKNIQSGENIVEFTPKKLGAIPFSCWMGMVRGKFLVE